MRRSRATVLLLISTVLALYAYDGHGGRMVLKRGSELHDQALEVRTSQYYQYVHFNQWAQAYQFRTPAYRRAISQEQYVLGMERDNASWTLKEVYIMHANKQGQRVRIQAQFKAVSPNGYGKKVAQDETSWQLIDGTCYCYEDGERSRLPLNAARPAAK